jgi:hypothetical protein
MTGLASDGGVFHVTDCQSHPVAANFMRDGAGQRGLNIEGPRPLPNLEDAG